MSEELTFQSVYEAIKKRQHDVRIELTRLKQERDELIIALRVIQQFSSPEDAQDIVPTKNPFEE